MPKSEMMCSNSLKYDIFNFIAFLAKSLLGYAADGTSFLTSASALELGYFILGVIPPIIFFIAFVQNCYTIGVGCNGPSKSLLPYSFTQ
jgi:nucleoside permease NupC